MYIVRKELVSHMSIRRQPTNGNLSKAHEQGLCRRGTSDKWAIDVQKDAQFHS